MNYKVLVAAALAATVVQASTVEETLPEPWFKNGQAPAVTECMAGVDSELISSGIPNMTLRCESAEQGFVSVMQQFSAANYLGNRLRYSASMKAEGIEDWGGLWMRVDNSDRPTASFDNMQNRPIKGTMDWTQQQIVLDVSASGDVVSIGMLMNGRGQLWVKDIQIEVVGFDVPVTDMGVGNNRPPAPQNLELTN